MGNYAAMIAVDRAGHEWFNVRNVPPEHKAYKESLDLRWLSNRSQLEVDVAADIEHYFNPFVEEPALFRIFARLPSTPEAVLAFANEYADLVTAYQASSGGFSTLADWSEQIERMRRDVELADSLLAAKTSKKNRAKNVELLEQLVLDLIHDVEVTIRAKVVNGKIVLMHVVYDLLSAMRLQLAESITESKSYRSCEFCNKPFEVTPQINRADRLYCSDNCRVKAHQRRRKQAIALREQGWTLRKIVAETGVEMETVKRWIEQAKRKEE